MAAGGGGGLAGSIGSFSSGKAGDGELTRLLMLGEAYFVAAFGSSKLAGFAGFIDAFDGLAVGCVAMSGSASGSAGVASGLGRGGGVGAVDRATRTLSGT